MRIATVAGDLISFGGLDRCQLDIARGLAARGNDVELYYRSDGALAADWRAFAGMVPLADVEVDHRHPGRSARTLLAAVAHGPSRGVDVVYAHHYTHLDVSAAMAFRRRAPLVYHLHTNPPASVGPLGRLRLSRVDLFLAVSRSVVDRWHRFGIEEDRLTYVHNGADMGRCRPASDTERRRTKDELGLAPDEPLVLFAGRLHPSKGVEDLLAAWRLVAQQDGGAQLAVLGTLGPAATDTDRAWLEHLQDGGPERTTWLDHLDDPTSAMRAADLVVVPSVMPDPCPLVVAESLACGTPVIATERGGIPEMLSGMREALVAAGDPAALSTAILGRARWRRDDPTLGQRCRAYAETHLNLDRTVEGVERELRRAIAGP